MRPHFDLQNKFLLLLIIFTIPLKVIFGQVHISGEANGYKQDSLVFYYFPDPVTHMPVQIDQCSIDSSGYFHVNFPLKHIQQVFTDLGANTGYLFIDPGKTYKVSLPPWKSLTTENYLSPFFFPHKLHLGVLNAGNDDLNLLINQFDLYFDPFFNQMVKYAYINRIDTNKLNQFCGTIDTIFKRKTYPSYFQNYVQYKKDLLWSLKYSGTNPSEYLPNFPSKQVSYNNPAYTELFNQVFNRILKNMVKRDNSHNLIHALVNHENYFKFQEIFNAFLPFQNTRLNELILLKGIYDECFETDFRKEDLLSLLDSLSAHTRIDLHKKIASNIKWKVTRLDKGQPTPFFRLLDQNGKARSPQDFLGKYVYLNFASFNSYPCRVQFPLLETLSNKYENQLEIVTISVDASREEMIQTQKAEKLSWTFLYFDKNKALLEAYNIKGYPTYFLIDPEGKIIQSFALSPPEGFEKYFMQIIK